MSSLPDNRGPLTLRHRNGLLFHLVKLGFRSLGLLALLSPALAYAQDFLPAKNDAATEATFKIVDGTADRNSGSPEVLHDGKPPTKDDDPRASFFFAPGTDGGRISIDLGSAIRIRTIRTSSLHPGSRGPQVYQLYASQGTAADFSGSPKRDVDPTSCGWQLIHTTDTRTGGGPGHQVSIESEILRKNKFRHLLFDIKRPDPADSLSNTFYNEIDVIDADAPAEEIPRKQVDTVASKDGKYRYILDSTEAPDLRQWTLEKLIPVMEIWYPKIIGMIPVDGYTPPDTVHFALKNATNLPGHAQGVPGYATGNRITLNASFMRDNKTGEAIGCAVHEIVHVVQFAGDPRPKIERPPTWVTEGACDYIRWFLYEPEVKGAEITKGNVSRAKYDGSYRISANFMDWVIRNHEKDLMRKLNLSIHRGYSEDLWKEWTGKSVGELGAEWKKAHEARLGVK
ncbi:basic secretory protein-like protein [Luteolibacter sp. SL250]|uniref:basic secretory protein-like protein n=1 Tax=Luteolibacter sp. SL250 TaxID=2995170 RepID=UPI00226DE2F0|nr:basic secretory protein-like protein [Luteolibacter sp. SL250]WAC20276.1 basic secretory protein-like protein [Luteolibacter sp. SL250]